MGFEHAWPGRACDHVQFELKHGHHWDARSCHPACAGQALQLMAPPLLQQHSAKPPRARHRIRRAIIAAAAAVLLPPPQTDSSAPAQSLEELVGTQFKQALPELMTQQLMAAGGSAFQTPTNASANAAPVFELLEGWPELVAQVVRQLGQGDAACVQVGARLHEFVARNA